MTDLFALLLKLAGVAFVLVAAIGVVRLPDPFLRMHAATKAGTLGAGLALVGVALAFGDFGTAVVAMLTIVFLLATLPIASHLLGRAAYVSGAALWDGTGRDGLAGVLARQATPLAVPPAAPRAGPGPTAGATLAATAAPAPDAAARPDTGPGMLDRVLVAILGPAPGPCLREAALHAPRALGGVEGLALLDGRIVEDVERARGGGALFREACRAKLGEAVRAAEAEAGRMGLRLGMHYEEGDVPSLLAGLRGGNDLLVVPARGWFDHGADIPSGCYSWRPDGMLALQARGHGPMLMVGGDCAPVERVLVLDDGSARLAGLTGWMLRHGLWADAEVLFVPRPGAPAADPGRRAELSRLAAGAGRAHRWLGAPAGTGACLLHPGRHGSGALVMSSPPGPRRTDWHGAFWLDRVMPGWRGRVLLP